MDIIFFSKIEELKNNKNKFYLIYLPGYKNDIKEIDIIKKGLFNKGLNVESLSVDYTKKFEEISNQIAEYIKNKYKGKVYLLGLSLGAVLAIKLANILGEKITEVFSLNPFYDRREIMEKRGIKDYEEICVKDFIPKNVKISIIVGMKDKNIDPINSFKIKELGKNIKLHKVPEGNHTFSDVESQNIIKDIIIKEITNF